MLAPSQLADLKTKDPKGYALLRAIVDAINQFGLQAGIDPRPADHVNYLEALPPPRAPRNLTAAEINGATFLQMEAGEGVHPSALYYVEQSDTRSFDEVTLHSLGHALGLAVALESGSYYFRAFARYQNSGKSAYTGVVSVTTSGLGALAVRKNSTGSVFSRARLNFIEGSNVTLTVADDGTEIDITIAASGGAATSYFEPVTNGDADFPEVLFHDGDIVMHEVPL
jgi:hypothetical protein